MAPISRFAKKAGADNFFLFGLTADEVEARRRDYNPLALIEADKDLQRVIELLADNHFNADEPGIFDDILRSLTEHGDYWMTLADFRSYVEAQKRAAKAYLDQEHWTRMSILNSATSGKFSSDRTIQEYNWDIWHLTPIAALPVGGKA